MGVGVGDIGVESVTHCLVECSKQRIVVREANGIPGDRVWTVADVGRAQVGIAACAGVVLFKRPYLVSVAVHLRINTARVERRLRSGDLRLVKRYRNGLALRVIPGIAKG